MLGSVIDGKISSRRPQPLRSNRCTRRHLEEVELRDLQHSGDINKFGQAVDRLLEYCCLIDSEADSAVGTYFHTPPTTAASVHDLSSPVREFDCIYKANAFDASPTSTTKIRHSDGHAGQFLYLSADLGGEIGKRPP